MTTPIPSSYFRLPLVLLGIAVLVCILTVWNPPAGRLSWFLEVGPGLAGIVVLIALLVWQSISAQTEQLETKEAAEMENQYAFSNALLDQHEERLLALAINVARVLRPKLALPAPITTTLVGSIGVSSSRNRLASHLRQRL